MIAKNNENHCKYSKSGTPSKPNKKPLCPNTSYKQSVEDNPYLKDPDSLIDIHTGNFPQKIINIGKEGIKLQDKKNEEEPKIKK